MTIERENLIKAAVVLGFVFLLGCLVGFFISKGMYQTHESVKIVRDTIVVNDTIHHYYPKPVEVERVRTEYQFFPVVRNVERIDTFNMHDSVLVEVPIESKHYHAEEYDAYVSGCMPSLDSIFVRQKTEYITETKEITKSVKQKRFGLGINAGYEYDFKDKKFKPCVGVGISYNLVTF